MTERCLLCRTELTGWGRGKADIWGVDQPVCKDCARQYRRAEGEEKARLRRRMLASPDLVDRAYIEQKDAEAEEQARLRREAQEERERMERERAQRFAQRTTCCDRPMEKWNTYTFQLGEHGFFLGDLDHLMSGSLTLTAYRCPCCGQVKFFDAEHRE